MRSGFCLLSREKIFREVKVTLGCPPSMYSSSIPLQPHLLLHMHDKLRPSPYSNHPPLHVELHFTFTFFTFAALYLKVQVTLPCFLETRQYFFLIDEHQPDRLSASVTAPFPLVITSVLSPYECRLCMATYQQDADLIARNPPGCIHSSRFLALTEPVCTATNLRAAPLEPVCRTTVSPLSSN